MNISAYFLLISLVIGMMGAIMSLAYLWHRIDIDFHVKILLTILGLENFSSFLISAVSFVTILNTADADEKDSNIYQICAQMARPIICNFTGNVVLTSLISLVQYQKTKGSGHNMCLILVGLTIRIGFVNGLFMSLDVTDPEQSPLVWMCFSSSVQQSQIGQLGSRNISTLLVNALDPL